MNFIRRSGWPALTLNEFDDIFSEFFGQANCHFNKEFPKSDQYVDDDGNLQIKFALAGYPKENLHVDASDELLQVSADKVEGDYGSFARRAFKRSFANPKGHWNFIKAEISYQDGMLTITVKPKPELIQKELEIK